nr:MAG TPA: hypothetical protein [Caudoviricetes sp.]
MHQQSCYAMRDGIVVKQNKGYSNTPIGVIIAIHTKDR